MHSWFQAAAIFLGVIGGVSFTLIAIYFCVKSGKCFCDVKNGGKDDTPEIEYTKVATDDTEEATEEPQVVTDKEQVVTDKEQVVTDKEKVVTDKEQVVTDKEQVEPDEEELWPDDEQLATAYSVRTSPTLSSRSRFLSDDEDTQLVVSDSEDSQSRIVPEIGQNVDSLKITKSEIDKSVAIAKDEEGKSKKEDKEKRKSQKKMNKPKIQGNLRLTMKHSSKDLFLFVVIHNIEGLIPEELPGIDQVRISLVLLPAKRYRSKTKFAPVADPEISSLFKFSNVSRADLLQSAIRFRLYGRPVKKRGVGGEQLLGELTVQLAHLAQKEKVFMTLPFQPPSKSS